MVEPRLNREANPLHEKKCILCRRRASRPLCSYDTEKDMYESVAVAVPKTGRNSKEIWRQRNKLFFLILYFLHSWVNWL